MKGEDTMRTYVISVKRTKNYKPFIIYAEQVIIVKPCLLRFCRGSKNNRFINTLVKTFAQFIKRTITLPFIPVMIFKLFNGKMRNLRMKNMCVKVNYLHSISLAATPDFSLLTNENECG